MLQIINLDPDCSSNERASAYSDKLNTSQLCSSVIYGTDVTVNVKPRSHTSGSSLVTTKNITNYAWATDKIAGSLIAIHCSGNYIAYAIKGPNGLGMVRIINFGTGTRGLVKNIAGVVRDVSFAYLTNQVFLACIDHFGSLFVHEIIDEDSGLRTELKLKVVSLGPDSRRAKFWHESPFQRVVWCPYIPEDPLEDEQDEDNCALILTVTNGSVAEVWHLGYVLQDDGPVLVQEPKIGYELLNDHSDAITDAAFSPDGTALATASMDGYVKFFQMNLDDPSMSPRCLHQWNPHDGQPISCLFFLDNYKHPNVDGLWKYAVTGANNNTELKVWSCQNWSCHQTINFILSDDNLRGLPSYPNFKASIDPTSRHIILSDIARRVVCVAILNQDKNMPSESEEKESDVKFISISEIAIQMGAICLAINDATFQLFKQWKDDTQLTADECDDESDIKIVEGLVMHCFLINQKSLQQVMIKFQPCVGLLNKIPENMNISNSQDNLSFSFHDGLTDLSLTMNASSDQQTISTTREEDITPSFPKSLPEEVQDNDALLVPPTLTSDGIETIISPSKGELLATLYPVFSDFLGKTFPEDSDSDVHSYKDSLKGKKLCSAAVRISKNGITYSGSRKSNEGQEWGNKLDGAVSSSPSTYHRQQPQDDSDEEVQSAPSTDLLQPQDTRAITAASSTSSPSLEVQQILDKGKIDEYMDTQFLLDEEEKVTDENNVKCLADILGSFSLDKKLQTINVWETEVPHLLGSTGLPLLTPGSLSVTKDINNIQDTTDNTTNDQLVPLNDFNQANLLQTIVAQSSTRSNPETEQAPQLSGDGSQDSQLGIFQGSSLPPIVKHITCEQLETRIKHESPVSMSDSDATSSASNSNNFRHFCLQFGAIQNELKCIKESLNTADPKVNKQLTQQSNKVEAAVDKINAHCKKLQTITKQVEDFKKKLDKFVEGLPNLVALNIKNGIENSIKKEVKTTMYQATNKSMESLRTGMQSELRCLLGNIDRQMIDHISRTIHSKQFMENICLGVTVSLSNSINNSVKECHTKVLVPGFNISTSQMFSQLNDAFSRGTKEYMNHVHAETKAIEATITDKLAKGCASLENVSGAAAESLSKSQSLNNGMSEMLESRLRLIMREEIAKALQEQNALLERQSRAQTPLAGSSQSPFSVKNAQQQLQSHISRQEFNCAFKHALMLSDLNMVVFVCERVNPHQLFSHSPCPLTQEVLLSLINQLSYDLSTYTDLKIKYLEEAVMTLDMNHQVTKEHLRTVLGDCQRALTNHLSINPNQKKLKMLLLAVNQLLSSA